MKNIDKVLTLVLIGAICAAVYALPPTQEIKVGQVWEYCIGDKDDPFLGEEGRDCYFYTILDIKGDYVLYKWEAEDGTIYDNDSDKKRRFLAGGMTLVKENES